MTKKEAKARKEALKKLEKLRRQSASMLKETLKNEKKEKAYLRTAGLLDERT